MKKHILILICLIFSAASLYAQAPEKLNYQGIARNTSGLPFQDRNLGLRISILDGGTVVYVETNNISTNAFGLYKLAIGAGTPTTGTFGNIDWSSGNKFIKVEIDPNGGTNYTTLGTNELLSVPYALYAQTTGSTGGSDPTGPAGGDLTGTYPDPQIAPNAVTTEKIQDAAISSTKLDNGAVTAAKLNQMGASSGQILKWNGAAWVPSEDEMGGGAADDWGSQVVESNATLEGEGTAANPLGLADNAVTTAKIADNAITSEKVTDGAIGTAKLDDGAITSPKLDGMGAINGQVLKFNGTNWIPATDETGTGGGTGDDWGTQVAQTTDRLSGDGTTANPLDIAQQGATNGQILKWNGTDWAPEDETAAMGDDWGTQVTETDATLNGDGTTGSLLSIADYAVAANKLASGAVTTPKIADNAITSPKIDGMGATNGQVLKFNGTNWVPGTDDGGTGSTYTAGDGIDISGTNEISADLGTDIETNELQDAAVTTPKIADNAITSTKLDAMGATNGQFLKFDGTNWVPDNVTGGTGDNWGSQVAQTTDRLSGDGTSGNPLDLAPQGANNGQVLKWNGTAWEPADDETGTGGGSGDDWGNQVVESDATMDGEGTTADPLGVADNAITTNKLLNSAVTSEKLDQMGASADQFLKWDGTAWVPSNVTGGTGDNWGSQVAETDATLNGEGTTADPLGVANDAITTDKLANGAVNGEKINDMGATTGQVLQFNGTTWEPETLSGGGTGDDWGNQIAKTDATLDGDGTTANPLSLADAAVTGIKIDQMSAATGQVLKWNGTTWAPADDEEGTGGGAGDDWGTQVVETDASFEGNGTAADPLALADNAVTTAKILDNAVTAEKIENNAIGTLKLDDGAVTAPKIDQMGALNDQVLKWNGTNWAPADDEAGTGGGTGDDWGAQVVETDATLTGDGTTGNELGLAQNGATDGQILSWDDGNSVWTPTNQTNSGAAFFEADADKISYAETNDFGKNLLINSDQADHNSGNEYKMMFLPSKEGAIRAGKIGNDYWNLTNIGTASVGFGRNTTASGDLSTAMGNTTYATAPNATAMGNYSLASGTSSTAIGNLTLASGENSTAMGNETEAIGKNSSAMGLYTDAIGENSTAMGRSTEASGEHSTAMGYGTQAIAYNATAIGFYTSATDSTSTAIGYFTNATGKNSTAMGGLTRATGESSTAMGYNTESSSFTSTSMGWRTEASGSFSTAMGQYSKAAGESSTAMGNNTQAIGNNSLAMGSETKAVGNRSFAMGFRSEANGHSSIAMGNRIVADGLASTVIGSNVKVTQRGAMYLADDSRGDNEVDLRTTTNRFYARFANGYYLYTDPTDSFIGVKIDGGGNSWSTISDRNKKENIQLAEGDYFIESIKKMPLGSWNYIGQDKKEYRHWGPMAQDMYKYFGNDGIGTIGNDTTIATADIDGVMMIAIQQLARENDSIKKTNNILINEIAVLKKEMKQQAQTLEAKIDNYAEEKQILEAKVEDFDLVKMEMEERLSQLENLLMPKTERKYTKR